MRETPERPAAPGLPGAGGGPALADGAQGDIHAALVTDELLGIER